MTETPVALVDEPMPSEREIRVPPLKLYAPWSVMKIYGIKGNLFPDRFVVDVAR